MKIQANNWLSALLRRLWRWLGGEIAVEADATTTVVKPAKEKLRPTSDMGEFIHISDLLAQLDKYFEVVHKLKRDDHDAYDLFSRVGGQICSSEARYINVHTLEPYALQALPSFFMMSWLGTDTETTAYAKLAYFRKMHRWAFIERAAVDEILYEGGIYFVNDDDAARRGLISFYVAVSQQGRVRCLKQMCEDIQTLPRPARRDADGMRPRTKIRHHHLAYPTPLVDWAKEQNRTLDEQVGGLFISSLNAHLASVNGFRVTIVKNGVTAAVNVGLLATAAFFKNRDITINSGSGRRTPIIHLVKTFTRKNGQVVRSHLRGERAFRWNGYDVRVSLPGKHGAVLNEFDAAAYATMPGERDEKTMLDSAQLGRMTRAMAEGSPPPPDRRP